MRDVVITGASTGIGRALVISRLRAGDRVWAAVRSVESLADLKLNPEGAQLNICKCDVSSDEDIAQLVRNVASELQNSKGSAHGLSDIVLINNAGIAFGGPIEAVPISVWKKLFDVNFFGLLRVTQMFLPLVRKKRGLIINIGSISGRIASPFLGPYASSKFAVRAFTDSLRREMSSFGVRVVLVEPGPVQTPIWTKSVQASQELEEALTPEMQFHYGAAIKMVRESVDAAATAAIPVSEVCQLIDSILNSKSPRPYYLIGKNIRFQSALAQWLPTKWLDRLIGTGVRFYGKKK